MQKKKGNCANTKPLESTAQILRYKGRRGCKTL